jgi:uncharacterized membrane protein YfcA
MEMIAAGSVAILASGILRGFTGFGIGLAGVPLLALVAEPRLVVPSVMFLQIASGMQNLARDRRHVDIRLLLPLMPGALLGIVPGLWLLLWLSADVVRLGIGLLVVGTVLLLARGFTLAREPRRPTLLVMGAVSGVLNGLAAMAGPPMIALLFALRRPPEIIRATLAAYFLFTGCVGLAMALVQGVIRPNELWFALALLPALFLGLALGGRLFDGNFRRHYRKVGLALLLLAGLAAALRGALGLWLFDGQAMMKE